ncbi:MAG: hypothetical protein QOE01_1672 [Actinomycetota bacterium]|nr:hypothetical protein [Actinomycetota bacterium]
MIVRRASLWLAVFVVASFSSVGSALAADYPPSVKPTDDTAVKGTQLGILPHTGGSLAPMWLGLLLIAVGVPLLLVARGRTRRH